MPHVFDKHISVSPFNADLVLHGLRATREFDVHSLRRLQWPQEKGVRKAGGGDGGQVVQESIKVVWDGDHLVFPIADCPQSLADRGSDPSIIKYHGMLLAQLDGEVAYEPALHNTEFYYILVENVDHKFNALRFAADQTAVIDSFVKHSMPIPSKQGLEYVVHHRSVNAVDKFVVDPHEPLVFNIMKVDRTSLVATGRIAQKGLASGHEHHSLPKSFSKKLLPLEEASAAQFEPYGQIVLDAEHNEAPQEVMWPGATTQDGFAGVLEQDFQMRWEAAENAAELVFEGLTGSFAGDKGKPGVKWNSELGIYEANLLLTRPDSSFFLKTAAPEAAFAMAFALPKDGKGDPDEHSLRAFVLRGGQAIRLHPFVWHTVPIPLASLESALLTEVVAATNASITIDVQHETGHPMQFTPAI